MLKYELNFDGQWNNDGQAIFIGTINNQSLLEMEYLHMKNVFETIVDNLNENDKNITLSLINENLLFINESKEGLFCPEIEVVKDVLKKLKINYTLFEKA